MVVELLPQHEAILAEQLASGRYANAEEIVGRALNAFCERERKQSQLRALIQEGIDELERGEGVETSAGEILAELRAGK